MKKIAMLILIFFGTGFIGKTLYSNTNKLDFKNYTKEQNMVLSEILNSFDQYLKNKMEEEKTSKAYYEFLKKLLYSDNPTSYFNSIYELDSICNTFIIKLKANDIYTDIWYDNIAKNMKTKKKYIVIDLNFNGYYWKAMKEKLNHYKIYNDYFKNVESMRDIPPNIVASFPSFYDKANFKDSYVRLFVLIHFITVLNNDLAKYKQ